MDNRKYHPRGTAMNDPHFMSKLRCFKHIKQYSLDKNSQLDIQYRGDAINIYYKGGSLLKLKGQSSIDFDEKYFYPPAKNQLCSSHIVKLIRLDKLKESNQHDEYLKLRRELTKSKTFKNATDEKIEKYCEEAKVINERLRAQRKEQLLALKNAHTYEETVAVIEFLKTTIDKWRNSAKQTEKVTERSVQHYISLNNKQFDRETDFLVLDIEYAISSLSDYKKEGVKDHEQPRWDILAIDRAGQLYVFELKYGMGCVDQEKAGIEAHSSDFLNTVGHDGKWRAFMDDIEILYASKKYHHLISPDVVLDKNKKPIFAFILKCEKCSDKESFKHQLREKNMESIFTLYLPQDAEGDVYPSSNYKLSKNLIQ